MPSQNEIAILLKARNEASAQLQKVQRDLDPGLVRAASSAAGSMSSFLRGAAQQAVGFAGAMAGVSIATKAFDAARDTVLGFNASMEQANVGWAVMLKNGDAANAMLAQLQKFAAQTPFEFPDIERGARRLTAMGFSAQEVLDLLPDIGNASAATGDRMVETFNSVIRALGQVQTTGRAQSDELNQLAEAGIPIWQALAAEIGKSPAEVRKMVEEGKVGAETLIRAFQNFSRQNFGGLMEQQSRTFLGSLATIRDQLRIVGGAAFKPLFDRISELAGRLSEFVQSGDFVAWGARVAAGVEVVLRSLGTLVPTFTSVLGSVFRVTLTIGQLIYEALQYLNPFARHSPSLVESVEGGVARIEAAFFRLGRSIPGGVQPAADAIARFRDAVASGLETITGRADAAMAKHLSLFGADAPAAYRAAMDAIAELEGEAAALGQTIAEESGIVRELESQHAALSAAVQDAEDALREGREGLRAYESEVEAARDVVADFDLQIAELEAELRNTERALQPLRDGLRDTESVLSAANLRLSEAEVALAQARAGYQGLRDAVERASDAQRRAEAQLERSRDAFQNLDRQAKEAQRTLADIARAPLQGSKQYRDALFAVEQQMAAVQLQMTKFNRGQVNLSQYKRLEAQLDALRRRAEQIRLREQLDLGPQRRAIQEAVDQSRELTFDEAIGGIGQAQSALATLTRQAEAARTRMEQDEQSVRAAQDVANAAKDALAAEEARLAPLIEAVRQRKLEVEAAGLVRDRAKNALELANASLEPQRQLLAARQAERTEAQTVLTLAQARLEAEQRNLRPLEESLRLRQAEAETVSRQLSAQRDFVSQLETAQRGLTEQASNWRRELEQTLSAAERLHGELESERKAAEAAAKAAVGGAAPGGDKLAGFDFEASRRDLEEWQAAFNQSVADIEAEWGPRIANLNENLAGFNTSLKNASTAINNVTGPANAFMASIAPMGPVLEPLAKILGLVVLQKVALARVIGPLLARLTPLITSAGALRVALLGIAAGTGGAGAAIAALGGPIGLLVLAISGLAIAWAENWGDIQGKTAEALRAIGTGLQQFAGLMVGVIQEVGGMFTSLGQTIADNAQSLPGPLREAAQNAGRSLIDLGSGIQNSAADVRRGLENLGSGFVDLGNTINYSDAQFEAALSRIEAQFDEFGSLSQETAEIVAASVPVDRVDEALGRLEGVWSASLEQQRSEIASKVADIDAEFDHLGEVTEETMTRVRDSVPEEEVGTALELLREHWATETSTIKAIVDDYTEEVESATETVEGALDDSGSDWTDYSKLLGGEMAVLKADSKSGFQALADNIADGIGQAERTIGGFFSGLGTNLRRGIDATQAGSQDVGKAIPAGMQEGYDERKPHFLTAVELSLTQAFPPLAAIAAAAATPIGRDIVSGMQKGVEDAWKSFTDFLGQQARSIPNPFTQALEAGSPSELLAREVGVPIPQGIAAGVYRAWPVAEQALEFIGGEMGRKIAGIHDVVIDAGLGHALDDFVSAEELAANATDAQVVRIGNAYVRLSGWVGQQVQAAKDALDELPTELEPPRFTNADLIPFQRPPAAPPIPPGAVPPNLPPLPPLNLPEVSAGAIGTGNLPAPLRTLPGGFSVQRGDLVAPGPRTGLAGGVLAEPLGLPLPTPTTQPGPQPPLTQESLVAAFRAAMAEVLADQGARPSVSITGVTALGIPGGLEELARLLGPVLAERIKAELYAGGS